MSGLWAREADALDIDDGDSLAYAASWLADALHVENGQSRFLRRASAVIRSERRRLDPEGWTKRCCDWSEDFSDEDLIWAALRMLATSRAVLRADTKARYLRQSEAALRTLHKRRSDALVRFIIEGIDNE